jgi:uncharacterized membrane protein YkoI
MKHFISLTALGIMTASATAIAADKSDIRLLDETKITLSEAIAAAEKTQGGRAIEASLDDDSFSPAYEVSLVVENDTILDVQVDAVSGKVTGAREDKDD